MTQDFLQVQDIDIFKTFAPIIRKKLLRIYLIICMAFNLFIYQVDIVRMYLESQLDDNKFLIFIWLSLEIHKLCQI